MNVPLILGGSVFLLAGAVVLIREARGLSSGVSSDIRILGLSTIVMGFFIVGSGLFL